MHRSLLRCFMAGVATITVAVGTHAGLIVHYDMEETSGPTVFDSVVAPASDGTIGGNSFPVQDSPGFIGNGIQFVDTGADGGTDGGTIRLGTAGGTEWKATGDFTATMWVNLASVPNVQDRLIDTTNSNGAIGNAQGWRLQMNAGAGAGLKLQLQAKRSGSASSINATLGTLRDLSTDLWTFVALRYDADGDATVTLLFETDTNVDAAAVVANSQSTAAIGGLTYGGGAVPRLGSNQSSQGKFFDGSMDEVRLYNTALSDAELAAVFAIPEPATALMMLALAGLAFRRRG